jgi:hypothetical protein
MADSPIVIKIGDLLIRSNIVTAEELEDSMKLADKMRVPLGRVLQMHGYCKETQLVQVLEVQQLIIDRTLTLENGVKAVEMVVKQGLDVDTAVRRVNPIVAKRPEGQKTKNKIGQLLRMTGIITQKQLEESLTNSLNTNLPLGLLLVNSGAISMHVLSCSLKILEFMRDDRITRDMGTHALRLARLKRITAEEALIEQNGQPTFDLYTIGVGDLLLRSGLISESQLLTAKEVELVDEQLSEKVFAELGFVSELCLSAATHLLSLVHDGSLQQEQACHIILKLKSAQTSEDVAAILATIDSPDYIEQESVDMTEVLLESGLVSAREIEEATPLALSQRKSLVRTLIERGIFDERTGQLLVRVKEFLDAGVIAMEQAKIVVAYSVENDTWLDDSLRVFGWSVSMLPTD